MALDLRDAKTRKSPDCWDFILLLCMTVALASIMNFNEDI